MYLQILIIDPDLESAKRLKYFLQNDAVRVYYTVDVLDGIRHLAHYHHQLVIMDVPGDGMDGFQSLRLIQELALAPILVISADHEPEHIVRILSIADNFTVKPLDLKICEVKIQALIRRSQNRETAWDAPPVLSID